MSMIIPSGAWPANMSFETADIASGAAVSQKIATQGRALVGIFTPTNGWTAAAIGYKVGWSGNDAEMYAAYDNGGILEQTLVSTDAAAASVFIAIPTSDAIFAPYIKLTSVTAASTTGVNQAAARTLVLVFRTFLS